MFNQRPKTNLRFSYFKAFVFMLFVTLIFPLFVACEGEKKEYVNAAFDRETVPTMSTDSVTELISDSGLIRYKLKTEKWLVFEKSSNPHWFFPKGLSLQKFDTLFRVETTLRADTAWNYTQRKLWKLKGKVLIKNALEETFSSEELFWDERSGKIYSEKYIEINQPGKLMLKGFGFESNQQMTEYQILKPYDGSVYVNEDRESEN